MHYGLKEFSEYSVHGYYPNIYKLKSKYNSLNTLWYGIKYIK